MLFQFNSGTIYFIGTEKESVKCRSQKAKMHVLMLCVMSVSGVITSHYLVDR